MPDGPSHSFEKKLRISDLPSFSDRRLHGDLIITFRCLNNIFSIDMSSLFPLNDLSL